MGATAHTLRCPRCKKNRQWDHTREFYDKLSDKNLVPTGRRKVIKTTAARVHNVFSVEMKHDGQKPMGGGYCGHIFWTTHPSAVEKVVPENERERRNNATVHNYGPRSHT